MQELMDVFHVSKRTIYYDMDKINHWLRQGGLAPVQYVRGRGFLLPEASRSQLPSMAQSVQPQQYYLSSGERKALLCLRLVNRSTPLFLHDMEALLQVSRGTAHAELKRLKKELEDYALSIQFDRKQGYFIQGNEKDIRAVLSRFLFEQLSYADWNPSSPAFDGLIHTDLFRRHFPAFREEELASVYRIIVSTEQRIGMEWTDETILHLTLRIWLSANRMKQGRTVQLEEEEKAALRETLQFKAATQIADELGERFDLRVPEDEIGYLAIYLLAAKVNRVEVESDTWETKRLRAATEEVIDQFAKNGCVYFQNREALVKQLFLHVKSMFYRIKYGLTIDNPLTDKILEEYREVYELTQKSASPLERLFEKPLGRHEIAYLTMHFGGWLKREQAKTEHRKRAAVVCVNGVSASRLLKNQLEQLFPSLDLVAVLSLREFEKFTDPVDLIFSTVPLSGCQVPVFILNAVMSDAEKTHLLSRVNPYLGVAEGSSAFPAAQEIVDLVSQHVAIPDREALLRDIQRYLSSTKVQPPKSKENKPTLVDLLKPSRITIREQALGWREAIRLAAQPLLQEGTITGGYVQAMIDYIDRYGPYIIATPGVAIAHARPEDGAVRASISLLVIRDGVPFSDQPNHLVNLLFVVVGIDGQFHLRALTQLANLLMEERNRYVLGSTDDKAEMMHLFQHYSDA